MRPKHFFVLAMAFLMMASSVLASSDSEEEFVRKYFNKIEKKHTKKLTWISGYFQLNRINRDNDYNKFASYETTNFTDASIGWLGEGKAFGMDFGLVFNKRFAWTLSGEYWLKLGESLEGTYFYEPIGDYIENPSTEIQVYGISTGFDFYLMNPPQLNEPLKDLAIRVGTQVGFYKAKWEVWEEYQNLNLATSTPDASVAAFEDQAMGFSFHVGCDYPTRLWNLVLGMDMSYLYLNFDNVAYFNEADQEIVASYSGDADGRVDLGLSGVRGKIEIKHFFSW